MITVLYHDDADGFGAAYAVWKTRQGGQLFEVIEYIPVQYGQPVPEIPEGTERLYILDFSYDFETMRDLSTRYPLLVIDHHKTAEAAVRRIGTVQGCDSVFDLEASGAMLTWHFVSPFMPPPILRYVQDRDLWRFELPDSEAVNLYIASLPREFEVWDGFDLDTAVAAGMAIKAFRDGQIRTMVKAARVMGFYGHLVPVVNCTANISEVGHALLQEHADRPFAVMYFDRGDGRRVYCLRSRGDFDVAELARRHGGGGHTAAAGFEGEPRPI